MFSFRSLAVVLVGAAVALGACGSGQDPALVPSSTTEATGDATGTPPEEVADEVVLENIPLSGAAEVPGPGDEDGDGFANFFLRPTTGEICYDLSVNGIEVASAAHIHEGGPDAAGQPVVTLLAPAEGSIDACVEADPAVVESIEADPASFYVNVHNAEFPDGALRGQLGTS